MRVRNLSFAQALQQAQALGYAEADPSGDVNGIDAAHKLTLLASMAFGMPVNFAAAYIEGISAIEDEDMIQAERLGYRIKLLGITKRRDQGIELRVHPALVPLSSLLANVEGPMNAVVVSGDAVGQTLYYGQGAGAEPTASAVVADLVDVTRLHTADPEHRVPHLAFQTSALIDATILPINQIQTPYYLRLNVDDQPGVLADIAKELADHQISIESLIQKPTELGGAKLIFLTHQALEANVDQAIMAIEQLPFVRSRVMRIRVETLQ